jgi:NAD(P)-dependent dehydrogenase (short-subunit alcohol dehydrogenase family)
MSDLAVVTGTTHGIGVVTCRELARAGRRVVMLCRDLAAGARVRTQILALAPHATIDIVHCDLASLAAVRCCAAVLRRDFGRIGLLLNNAGIVGTRRRISVDGYELTFATNHLGPFLLTGLLRDRIVPGGRIVNVASRAHAYGRLELEAVTDPSVRYRPTAAYAQSKLANVMHTFSLARRLAGTSVTANCLHPGVVATNLLPAWLRLVKPLFSATIDAERGARTSLHLALSDAVAGISGEYFDEHQARQPASELARNETMQEILWAASERWVGAAG